MYEFSFSMNFTGFVLHFPEKARTVSHPVNACGPSNARQACSISSTLNLIVNDYFTFPIEMLHALFCISVRMKRQPLICSATPSKIRNTFVSGIWTTMFATFSLMMFLACKSILVSSSSRLDASAYWLLLRLFYPNLISYRQMPHIHLSPQWHHNFLSSGWLEIL